ncbi:MAG: ABC transporter permease subunit, partial [Clostridiales bacterium]|nr:ABC transporter permease subunit [Clostridiales bacterium]
MEWSVMILKLTEGLMESVKIFTLTLLFSLPLGLFVAFGRMSKNWLIRNFMRIYISIMRGTPLILQLMVIYFGPFYIFNITLPKG